MTRQISVAVVVPIYRQELSLEEQTSLRHLEAHLGRYDRFFVAPESLHPRRPGFEVIAFADDCFETVDSYSRLLLSAAFYRTFSRYRYILVYQLDSLVFSDALIRWCEAGYDYVGAPWLTDPANPERGFSRVGNGGLSLRRVSSALEVLESARPVALWRDFFSASLPDVGSLHWRKRLRVLREARRGAGWYAGHYSLNEDRFWSDRAALFDPGFRVAPPAVALEFAFERAPRFCYARNGNRLPFGCHAWSRWDRGFWEPYLIPERAG